MAPLNYFLHAHGPASSPTMILGWVFAAIVTLVCVIIALLLLWAIFHKRSESGNPLRNDSGNAIRWIIIGTGISTATLFVMAVYALITLEQTAWPSIAPKLTITVTAYDWWWKIDYDNADPSLFFTTANEIHIPVGQPVLVNLKSADVIHAFWAPELAGKTEMIPGLTNQQWLEADKAGTYRGKCTQFCGLQHAHMDFEIIAQNAEDFEKWQQAQRQLTQATDGTAKQGSEIFLNHCSACHSVRGTAAQGMHGPDLTHVASRKLLAAGSLHNDPRALIQWVQHAQELKPGVQMPDTVLSPEEVFALNAYLQTLK